MSNLKGLKPRWLVGTVVAAGFALASCGSEAAPADQPPGDLAPSVPAGVAENLRPFYEQTLEWQPYDELSDAAPAFGDLQYAVLQVPLNYADPDAGQLGMYVYRAPATERSERSIVTNPGGPGGPGDSIPGYADAIFDPELLRTRDIVGFDPRAVGRSEALVCRTDAEVDAWRYATPDDPQEIAAQEQVVGEIAEQCLEAGADVLPHVGTVNVARDLEILRSALRQPTLDYLGFSYGTAIGQEYLRLFPRQAGRFVLDAVVTPDVSTEEMLLTQAQGMEQLGQLYAADCVAQGPEDCPLGESPAQVLQTMLDLVEQAEEQPISTGTDRPLTSAQLNWAMLSYLYSDSQWSALTEALVAAQNGDGTALQETFDAEAFDMGLDPLYFVNCTDHPTDYTAEQTVELSKQWASQYPLYGGYAAWEVFACSDWPVPAAASTETPEYQWIPPVVLIGGKNDPATPYVWSERAASQLPGSVLVTWEGVGHTAAGISPCVDEIVTRFMLDGILPPSGTVCAQ